MTFEQDVYANVDSPSDLNKVTPPVTPPPRKKPTSLEMENVSIDYRSGSQVQRGTATNLPLSRDVSEVREVTVGIFTLAVIAIVGAFVFAGTHFHCILLHGYYHSVTMIIIIIIHKLNFYKRQKQHYNIRITRLSE